MSLNTLSHRLEELEASLAVAQFFESLPDETLEAVAHGYISQTQLLSMMRQQNLTEQIGNAAAIFEGKGQNDADNIT